MDAADFEETENWTGGFYELAIDLGVRVEPGSTDRLQRALVDVWADDQLVGCYLDRRTSRSAQERVAPLLTDAEHPPPLYGIAQLPAGPQVVCATHIVREIDDPEHTPRDWLYLCLPVGALARVDPRVGGFPFEEPDTSLEWRRPIDSWLVETARRVHHHTPFELAIVDFEVDLVEPPDNGPIRATYLRSTGDQLAVHYPSG